MLTVPVYTAPPPPPPSYARTHTPNMMDAGVYIWSWVPLKLAQPGQECNVSWTNKSQSRQKTFKHFSHLYTCGRKEGRNVLFNDALNTFYLRLYGIRHMVKDHSDSGRKKKEMFYLTTHSTRFIYGYMASDIW